MRECLIFVSCEDFVQAHEELEPFSTAEHNRNIRNGGTRKPRFIVLCQKYSLTNRTKDSDEPQPKYEFLNGTSTFVWLNKE